MEANLNAYEQRLLSYIKGLKADSKVKISTISTDPELFTQTVKKFIDQRLAEVEFSNDYLYIIKKEEVNYERFIKR